MDQKDERKTIASLDDIGVKYAFDFGKGKQYTGGDKTSLGQSFTKEYEALFAPLRHEPVQLLELGVFFGKSLAMWSEYFDRGKIHGIDVCLKRYREHERALRKLGLDAGKVQVYEKDVTADDFAKFVSLELPTFDIIIDDALHTAKAQYKNFLCLFPKLNKGGCYVIEDVVESSAFFDHFRDLFICVSNCDSSFAKKSAVYSVAVKVQSVQVRQNMVIIKRK